MATSVILQSHSRNHFTDDQGVDFAPGRRLYFSGVFNLCKIIGEITGHEAQFPLTSLVKSRMEFVLFVMRGMLSE